MKLVVLLAPAFLALVPTVASATTVGFTYTGADVDDPYVTSTGSGTISFIGTGPLTMASLTGFSFAQTTTLSDPSLTGSGAFSYTLGDLLSFGGLFSSGSFSSLALKTRTVADPTGFLADQSFQIRSLRPNGASTAFDNAGSDEATLGTVRIVAPVPEPATWATMIVGLGLTGFALRRYRKVATRVTYAV